MSIFTLSMTFAGEQQVLSALSRFGEYADDLRPVYLLISKDFQKVTGEKFDAEGPGWAPLSGAYAKWKRAHYPGRGILVLSGDLKASLTGGSGYVEEVSPSRLIIGTRVPYAPFHHFGITGRMPARRLVDIDAPTRTRWAKITQAHLVERWQEARAQSGA